MTDDPDLLSIARGVLDGEARGIGMVSERIDGAFTSAVRLILDAKATIVTGLGKSGLVGAKLAGTLASTSTPSHFVHAAEAMHGDAGRLQTGDVLIGLSYSGTTGEVIAFAEIARRRSVPVIAMTGGLDSPLAGLADHVIDVRVVAEADPHDLAPTTSTTVAMAMGDALAVCVMTLRGTTREQFRENHPGGALGGRLAAETT